MLGSVSTLADVIWNHPANRGRRLSALAKSVAWQFYKRTIARPFDLPAFGLRFRCYPDSHDASRMIYFNGLPDPSEMTFMRRYLRSGDSVIDGGANVGVYTLFFSSLVGCDGRILAFEPDPVTAMRLRENIAINGLLNVTVRECAISDHVGTTQFTQGADTGNALYALRTYDRPAQTVHVTTLDNEICSDNYALGKLDIEGAELQALQGASASLGRKIPPVWIMELSEKLLARSGHSVADVEALLKASGFGLWRYRPEGNCLVRFVSEARRPGHVGDGIAIATEAVEMVSRRLQSYRN